MTYLDAVDRPTLSLQIDRYAKVVKGGNLKPE